MYPQEMPQPFPTFLFELVASGRPKLVVIKAQDRKNSLESHKNKLLGDTLLILFAPPPGRLKNE
jgi:hypothetical protein